MCAVVDAAGLWIGRVALAEGDQVPNEASIGVLRQLKHEPERRLRGTLLPERHVELDAAGKTRPVDSVGFAALQVEGRAACIDFPTSALGL